MLNKHHPMKQQIFNLLFVLLFLSPSLAFSNSIQELYEKAVDAYSSEKFDESIDYYNQILAQMPSFAPAYNGIGLAIRARDNDPVEAIRNFQESIKADPNFTQGYLNLGRMYYATEDFDQAILYFEKAIAINPNLSDALVNLGWVYLLAKANPPKAIKYFLNAYKIDKNPNTYFGLGMAYFYNNNREKAIDVVTALRAMKEEQLALKLENSMREKRRVSLTPMTSQPSASAQKVSSSEPVSINNNDVKVNLRGRLEDIK